MLGITVTDEDLNFGVIQEAEMEGAGKVSYVIPGRTIAGNEAVRFRTSKSPILSSSEYDWSGTGSMADPNIGVDYRDVILELVTDPNATSTPASITKAWEDLTVPSTVGEGRHPFSLENPQGGAFILRSLDDVEVPTGGIMFTVTYKAPDVQTADVHIASTQDTVGFAVTLTETGAATGVFTGSFQTAAESDSPSSSIAAISGSLITVSYNDGGTTRVANATVETTDPSVLLVTPADKTATRVRSARLIAEMTDADSGIDPDSITFNVVATDANTGGPAAGEGVTTTGVVPVSIAGGYRAEVQLENVPAGETNISWSVIVMDEAGNDATSGVSSIRIDTVAPDVNRGVGGGAITGNHLDGDGNAVTDASKADPTSIQMVFNEALDGDSLQASDFRVNGVAPADVAWSSSHPESVFLKVAILAANARPLVELTGDISDTAGNIRPGGKKVDNASDGISPTLDVTVDPAYSKGEVTIDIRTDESLLTVPDVAVSGDADLSGLSVFRLVADNHYRATYNAPTSPMKYEISVSGSDTSANSASVSGIALEVDAQLPAPTGVTLPGVGAVMVGDDTTHSITTQNPFITIEWDSEASEYEGDSHGSVDVTGLTISNESGESAEIKVTKPAANRLLISARGLALGTYDMSFNGADELGNTLGSDVALKFEVKEPDPFEIMLTPGWNLVSLPAEPQMSAINDVIPVDHPTTIVLTYDQTEPGAWLSAQRGDDGMFVGSLDTISARRAYWIFTEAFDSLKVAVMQQRGGSPTNLPTVNLVAGWNLLPVLDVSGGLSFGDDASNVGNYVSGAVRAYSYDSSSDRFNQHTGMLQIGSGYWVYLSGATVLVP